MRSVENLIAQVRKPPSLPNWVRLNHRRRDETTKSIVGFVLGKPRHALAKIYAIAADYVTFQPGKEAPFRALEAVGNPIVRRAGSEILNALIPWIDENHIEGIQVFHEMVVPFPIGRGIIVPVKPTFVFLNEGKLTPVFLIGWTTDPFSGYQKSLLSTIIHNAVLTLEGFQGSDAWVICVPRIKGSKFDRYVKSWQVSEFPLLNDEQLKHQYDRFGFALDDAVPLVLNELARRGDL